MWHVSVAHLTDEGKPRYLPRAPSVKLLYFHPPSLAVGAPRVPIEEADLAHTVDSPLDTPHIAFYRSKRSFPPDMCCIVTARIAMQKSNLHKADKDLHLGNKTPANSAGTSSMYFALDRANITYTAPCHAFVQRMGNDTVCNQPRFPKRILPNIVGSPSPSRALARQKHTRHSRTLGCYPFHYQYA